MSAASSVEIVWRDDVHWHVELRTTGCVDGFDRVTTVGRYRSHSAALDHARGIAAQLGVELPD